MARVPFLVSLNVCRFFPSRRSQAPLMPGPSPLADATYRGETLTEREGLPAGKAGTLCGSRDGDGTMNGGGASSLPAKEAPFPYVRPG